MKYNVDSYNDNNTEIHSYECDGDVLFATGESSFNCFECQYNKDLNLFVLIANVLQLQK